MKRLLVPVAAAVLAVAGLLDAARIPDASLRHQAFAMVLALPAVAVLAWLPFALGVAAGRLGAGLRAAACAAVALDVVGSIEAMRAEPYPTSIDPAVSIVWTVMLSAQLLAVLAVTARRVRVPSAAVAAGGLAGLSAFALWGLLCLMQPDVPQSNAPTVLALALAAVVAVQWAGPRRTSPAHSAAAGLLAAVTVALLAGELIDAGLPHLGRWVTNAAPPTPAGPHGLHRLVDPVGILMLGTLLAIALLVTVLVAARTRQDNEAVTSTDLAAAA
jgi:hypothetical protein